MLDVEEVPGAERVSEDIGVRAELVVDFGDEAAASEYERALVSLAGPGQHEVILKSGKRRTNTSVEEILQRMDAGLVARTRLALPGSLGLEVDRDGASVKVGLPFSPGLSTGRIWLQCSIHRITSGPILSLSTRHQHLTQDALNALVGLASHFYDFRGARLDAGDYGPVKWANDAFEGALPILSQVHGSVWNAVESSEVPESTEVTLWVERISPPRTHPDEGWWTTFDQLAASPRVSLQDVQDHLDKVFQIPVPWRIGDIHKQPHPNYAFGPEEGVVSSLIPTPDEVILAADLDLPPSSLAEVLLHACAHLELGHVMPGDEHAHWDTLGTATSTTPHRQWDRDARHIVSTFERNPIPKRASLEECTPLEKAWLVLYDHIGRMIGVASNLHEQAREYQSAAYQRQAAQRLVTQLDELGGGMLCDGVGLGKTYVATTVIVHYINAWRDALKERKESAAEDLFRVTILAPNSVVSTWKREAIPPLVPYGVLPPHVRVISHTKLSRILPNSEILAPTHNDISDMEHLLLSDLVIVDEAHNFRSIGAKRTLVLRDLLRMQPRRWDQRLNFAHTKGQHIGRRVLLLTATPVNNGIDDLTQQVSLLFSKPLYFNDNKTADGYRKRALKDVEERVTKARQGRGKDVAATLIHGYQDAKFSAANDFIERQITLNIQRIGQYLKDESKKLEEQQAAVRAAMTSDDRSQKPPRIRVASELLDRIVVQRSRNLCKQIEREQGSNIALLFRPDAGPPQALVYEDSYENTRNVLANFIPLFGKSSDVYQPGELSLKVYMWSDVANGIQDASGASSVVGLQRVLVLKRLESSPVAFLITVLRLVALHASRVTQLLEMASALGKHHRMAALKEEIESTMAELEPTDRDRLDLLITGEVSGATGALLLYQWKRAHSDSRPAAQTDEMPDQLQLLEVPEEESAPNQAFERLWELKEALLNDFQILLRVAPKLANIVFGTFEENDWPREFIKGGDAIRWPKSPVWGRRIVTDAKLERLVGRLLSALNDGQKAIVFSQFSDTLAYLYSVLEACHTFGPDDWEHVTTVLSHETNASIQPSDVQHLMHRTAVVSGETEDRDAVINAFAPYYRIGPHRRASEASQPDLGLVDAWQAAWLNAIQNPVDVMLASDVLAEGVNLQDASLLINYDVHWNPVRMIQRAGRVDRRLSPAVEENREFPELQTLAENHGVEVPTYWWHTHPNAAPVTINLLLPDELEEELHLRERIANKTLAIDFTLGLEQGTGAEAEWMKEYRYQGISALNAWQRDRAIEQLSGYQERLRRIFNEREIVPDWLDSWRGWLVHPEAKEQSTIFAWAELSRKGSPLQEFTRLIEPIEVEGCQYWLWTTAKPGDTLLNFWIGLDGKTFPPPVRNDLNYSPTASRPIDPESVLAAVGFALSAEVSFIERGNTALRPLVQGATAISAGFLDNAADRAAVQLGKYRLLEIPTDTLDTKTTRRGISRPCSVCGTSAGMHKCCPKCGATANDEHQVESIFGFRTLKNSTGVEYEVPQPWCRSCRTNTSSDQTIAGVAT